MDTEPPLEDPLFEEAVRAARDQPEFAPRIQRLRALGVADPDGEMQAAVRDEEARVRGAANTELAKFADAEQEARQLQDARAAALAPSADPGRIEMMRERQHA